MARARPGELIYHLPDDTEVRVLLEQPVSTLGRSDDCTITIKSQTVSRLHARIELQHDRYLLFDAGSVNGTYINGKPALSGQQLCSGDEIWLGSSTGALRFTDPEETLAVPMNSAPTPLLIDEHARSVHVYGVVAALSPLEYGLLVYLAANAGSVCTREACFQAVWHQPYDHATCEDALNACIAKLRRNLRASATQAGHEPPVITTIPRFGFRLDTEPVFAARMNYTSETPSAEARTWGE